MSNKVQYLYCKSDGSYYFRRKIPLALASYFPKASLEIRKSLRTTHLKTAKSRVKSWSFRTEKLFTLMRSNMFTFEQLQKIAQDFFHDFLKTDIALRVEYGLEYGQIESTDGEIDSHTFWVLCDQLEDDIRAKRLETKYLDPFLKKHSIKIDDEKQYKCLAKLIEDPLVEAYKVMIKRDRQDFNNKYDRNVDKLYESKPNTIQQANTQPQPEMVEDKGELFSTVVEGYIKEKQLADSWTAKTKQENEASFDLFIQTIGDKPVKTLNRQDFMQFKNTLSKLPPYMNTRSPYKGKSIDEVLAMKPENTLDKRTINKRLTHVGSVFGWAVLNQYINANYASELLLPVTSTAQDDKAIYSPADLQKMVSLLPNDNKRPERFWIPLIAIFSGARINELCQLYTEDIKLIDGIYCFDINKNTPDKKLKNSTSKRIIAVHPTLLDLGLIKYQEQCKNRGDERLWMKLNKGRDGYGQSFGRWYNGQFNRKLITQDLKKTFHSFRHTVINSLKQAGVQDTLISEIAGHKVDSMSMGRYGKRFSPKIQLEALKEVGKGLDITPLKEKAKALKLST